MQKLDSISTFILWILRTGGEVGMTEELDRDCNTCLFYDPMEGVCELKKEPRHGYDKPCSQWEDWEDNAK